MLEHQQQEPHDGRGVRGERVAGGPGRHLADQPCAVKPASDWAQPTNADRKVSAINGTIALSRRMSRYDVLNGVPSSSLTGRSTLPLTWRSGPSRTARGGRSFQKDANQGRARAGEVTGRSMAQVADNPQTNYFGAEECAPRAGWLTKLFWR